MQPKRRWLRFFLVFFVGLFGLLFLLLSFAIKPLAQMALSRLENVGFSATIEEASLFQGRLTLRDLQLLRLSERSSLRMTASNGILETNLLRLLIGSTELASLHIRQPTIQIEGNALPPARKETSALQDKPLETTQAGPKKSKPLQITQAGPKKGALAVLRERLRGQRGKLLLIRTLRIEGGKVIVKRDTPTSRLSVQIKQIDATLLAWKGEIQATGIAVEGSLPRRKFGFDGTKARFFFDGMALLEDSLHLPSITLEKPQIRLALQPRDKAAQAVPGAKGGSGVAGAKGGSGAKGAASRPALGLRKRLPWLQIGTFQINDGELRVSASIKRKTGERQPFQLHLRRIQGSLRDFHLRRLLAHPTEGLLTAEIPGHGTIDFKAQAKDDAKAPVSDPSGPSKKIATWMIRGVPIAAFQSVLRAEERGLVFEKGVISVTLEIPERGEEKVHLRAKFGVSGLVLSPTEEERGRLKTLALRGASRLVTGYFAGRKEYTLTSKITVPASALDDEPPRLLRLLAKAFAKGFLDDFFQKHQRLRRLQPFLERRLLQGTTPKNPEASPAPKGRIRGLFQRFRERRKKRQGGEE